mgnify:CR=1 FL=1
MVDSNTLYDTQKLFYKNLLDGTCQEVTTAIDVDTEPHPEPDYEPYHDGYVVVKGLDDIASLYPIDFKCYCDNDISGIKDLAEYYEKRRERLMENKVLELWYVRKYDKIKKEYEEKEREFNNSKELVIKYKEILDRFENELEELYESEENQEQNYIINTKTNNVYEYNINYKKLRDEFGEKYIRERNKELRDLDELKTEIEALLSLSDDLEYQVDVLTQYGVLDKKTKKMVV